MLNAVDIYLKEARQRAGMTQKQVAEHLGITIRSYQRIESGELLGSIPNWDALEDLFKVHQRKLRLQAKLPETWPGIRNKK